MVVYAEGSCRHCWSREKKGQSSKEQGEGTGERHDNPVHVCCPDEHVKTLEVGRMNKKFLRSSGRTLSCFTPLIPLNPDPIAFSPFCPWQGCSTGS